MFLDITTRGEFAVQGFETDDLGIFKNLPHQIHELILNELEISHKLDSVIIENSTVNQTERYLRSVLFDSPVYIEYSYNE